MPEDCAHWLNFSNLVQKVRNEPSSDFSSGQTCRHDMVNGVYGGGAQLTSRMDDARLVSREPLVGHVVTTEEF